MLVEKRGVGGESDVRVSKRGTSGEKACGARGYGAVMVHFKWKS